MRPFVQVFLRRLVVSDVKLRKFKRFTNTSSILEVQGKSQFIVEENFVLLKHRKPLIQNVLRRKFST